LNKIKTHEQVLKKANTFLMSTQSSFMHKIFCVQFIYDQQTIETRYKQHKHHNSIVSYRIEDIDLKNTKTMSFHTANDFQKMSSLNLAQFFIHFSISLRSH